MPSAAVCAACAATPVSLHTARPSRHPSTSSTTGRSPGANRAASAVPSHIFRYATVTPVPSTARTAMCSPGTGAPTSASDPVSAQADTIGARRGSPTSTTGAETSYPVSDSSGNTTTRASAPGAVPAGWGEPGPPGVLPSPRAPDRGGPGPRVAAQRPGAGPRRVAQRQPVQQRRHHRGLPGPPPVDGGLAGPRPAGHLV